MKVILVGDYPNSKKVHTGVQSVLVNLTIEFTKRKEIDLIIVSLSSNSQMSQFEGKSKIYKLDLRGSIFKTKKDFNKIVDLEKPDIIHLQGVVPGIFIYTNKFKDIFIVTQHAILNKERLWQVSKIRKLKFLLKEFVERIYFSRIQNIIFISQYNKNIYLNNNKQIKKFNYALIPNPVNELFRNLNNHSTASNFNEMYFVGEIKKRKGLLIILQAITLLKKENIHCKIHVIGGFKEKKYERAIKNIIKDQNLSENIVFCGWKNQNEIIEYTKDIPIFVLPSFQETLPLSIAEAMCQEKLVIATDVGGNSEMIRHDFSGFLFPVGNVEKLAEILKTIFGRPSLIKGIGENARKESENYYPKSIAFRTMDFYNDVIKNSN